MSSDFLGDKLTVANKIKKNAVVVLGMHRSGTSAIAGLLSRMGVDFGKDEKLFEAQQDVNARGFYEQREIVTLNQRLLNEIGSNWNDFRPIESTKFQSAGSRKIIEDIKGVLQHEFVGKPLWGLKDPRICRLLPVWLEILSELNINPSFVFIFRNPWEVASSLQKRDGILLQKGLVLWLSYVFDAEKYSRSQSRYFVDYQHMLSDWQSVVTNIIQKLSLPIIEKNINRDEINQFLSPDLRHMIHDELIKSDWATMQYDILNSFSTDQFDEAELQARSDRMREMFFQAQGLFDPIIYSPESAQSENVLLQEKLTNLSEEYEHLYAAYKQTREAYEHSHQGCFKLLKKIKSFFQR